MNLKDARQSGISVVWFSDLRLRDHGPLQDAIEAGRPTVLLYIAEPGLLANPHYDVRHWRFIRQSIQDMNRQLKSLGIQVVKRQGEVVAVLEHLHRTQAIAALYSHEETGLAVTWKRDQAVSAWCSQHGIQWHETPSGAIQRGLTHRHHWDTHWHAIMQSKVAKPELTGLVSAQPLEDDWLWPGHWPQQVDGFQRGGETHAWQTLTSFFEGRGQDYARNISKPQLSRDSCSRLSPYLAWGNLSLRQVYQRLRQEKQRPGWHRALRGFSSRLHWQGHFIQKFESEPRMEFEPVNRGYGATGYRNGPAADALLNAWQTGQTGYPLVDACMRAVIATGYLNFRMRAMLVSFLTHHLWLDWRWGVEHLGRQFRDFEPGIHYSQFQMQAGHTGRYARDRLWGHRKQPGVVAEKARILATHVRPDR